MVLKKRLFISLVGFAVMMAGLTIESKSVEISGRLKLFTSIFLTANPDGNFFCHDSGEFSLRRLEARLLFAGNVNPKISYKLRFDAYLNSGDLIDNTGFPESGLLGSPLLSEYMELNIYECAMKINGFLVKNLDLTVGKQRIFWGAADKVNVVDNLNPMPISSVLIRTMPLKGGRKRQSTWNTIREKPPGFNWSGCWNTRFHPSPTVIPGYPNRIVDCPRLKLKQAGRINYRIPVSAYA
jgi:hypothetical protein